MDLVIRVGDLDDPLPVPEGPLPPDGILVEDRLVASARRGRPKKLRGERAMAEVFRLYFVEKLSMRQVADVLGVSHMSVYRLLSDPDVELLI